MSNTKPFRTNVYEDDNSNGDRIKEAEKVDQTPSGAEVMDAKTAQNGSAVALAAAVMDLLNGRWTEVRMLIDYIQAAPDEDLKIKYSNGDFGNETQAKALLGARFRVVK